MKFTTLKIVNHHDEVEKALTISQIKELLQYVAETKHEVGQSFLFSMKDYDEGSQEYIDCNRMAERYKIERQALLQLAECLDEYVS